MSENTDKVAARLRLRALVMLVFLSVQFILGIINNLFVDFPQNSTDGENWIFAWQILPVILHIVLGIGLLVGSFMMFVTAMKNKSGKWLLPTTLSLMSVLGAGIFGALFVVSQNDIYSLSMAVLFITSVLSYSWGIYRSNKSLE